MRFDVTEEEKGKRLDVFVHNKIMNEHSREYVKKLIGSGHILLNDKKVKAGHAVNKGDCILIKEIEPHPKELISQDIPLDIIYEDPWIIVVNKPRGMVVHPGSGNHDGTLVNAVMHHSKGRLSGLNGESRPGIVHRIDKDTSWLLVIAASDQAHAHLAGQFKEHSIKKEYLALCEGQIEYNLIRIDKPISRSRTDRKKMAVDTAGKNAVSTIKVLDRYKDASYISINIETGRTHQIRVHLKSIGHPLIGDTKYGRKNPMINGQALHAAKLGFIHPGSKEYVEFFAEPPKDFKDLMDFLKKL